MKGIIKISFVIIPLLFCQSAEAQVFKKLKKGFKDKIEGMKKKDEADNEMQNENDPEGFLSGLMKDVNTESKYVFDVTATLKIESYGKKKETNTLTQGYSENSLWTTIDNEDNATIIDFKNEAIIILDNKKNKAQVMSLTMMTNMIKDNDNISNAGVDIKKTGKTRYIHGYKCVEYLITHEDGKMEVWFAPDVNFNYKDYLSSFSKTFKQIASSSIPLEKGYVMEMSSYNTKGELETKMTVVEIDEKSKSIDMNNYELQKMF